MRLPTASELRQMWLQSQAKPDDRNSHDIAFAAVNMAIDQFDAWTAAWVIDASWLQIALIQYGDRCSGSASIYPCPCGKQYANRKGFTRHFGKCDEALKEIVKMEAAFPTHPSNKTFIEQLALWGVEFPKRKGEVWKARFPNGEVVEVFAPTYHDGNPSSVFTDAYRYLGVTPQIFWGKTDDQATAEDVKAPMPDPEREASFTRGQSTQVLDILIGQRRPMTTKAMAEMTGLSHDQVSRAFYYLSKRCDPPLARRVKAGMYEATQEPSYDQKVGIDVNVGNGGTSVPPQPAESPQAASDDDPGTTHGGKVVMAPSSLVATVNTHEVTPGPDVKSEEEMDTLIIDFLDMIFPSGFSARHLAAIDRWRAATKALFREMSQ